MFTEEKGFNKMLRMEEETINIIGINGRESELFWIECSFRERNAH